MAGGKNKKKRNSKDSTTSSGGGGGGGGGGGEDDENKKKAAGGGGKKKCGSAKSSKFQGDIFNEGAMENAYCVCHNVQDVLRVRGFPWPEAAKKKKKGKKK